MPEPDRHHDVGKPEIALRDLARLIAGPPRPPPPPSPPPTPPPPPPAATGGSQPSPPRLAPASSPARIEPGSRGSWSTFSCRTVVSFQLPSTRRTDGSERGCHQ